MYSKTYQEGTHITFPLILIFRKHHTRMRPFITARKCVLQRRVKQITAPDHQEKPTVHARQPNQQQQQCALSVTRSPHPEKLNTVSGEERLNKNFSKSKGKVRKIQKLNCALQNEQVRWFAERKELIAA